MRNLVCRREEAAGQFGSAEGVQAAVVFPKYGQQIECGNENYPGDA